MIRIPEPELMEAPAQAEAYAAADFSEAHARFVGLFAELHRDWSGQGVVMDLGSGPCDVVIRFLKRYPECTVHAVEASAAMRSCAGRLLGEARLEDRVELIDGYLPFWAPAGSTYSAGLSNSLLHHLRDPLDLWRCLGSGLAPGAPFLVMDLLRPDSEAACDELVRRYAGDAPSVLKQDFANSLRAAYRPDEVSWQIAGLDWADATVRIVSDRHWAAFGRAH